MPIAMLMAMTTKAAEIATGIAGRDSTRAVATTGTEACTPAIFTNTNEMTHGLCKKFVKCGGCRYFSPNTHQRIKRKHENDGNRYATQHAIFARLKERKKVNKRVVSLTSTFDHLPYGNETALLTKQCKSIATITPQTGRPGDALRSPCRLDKACCEACPSRLLASVRGLFGGCKAGLTRRE